MNSLFKKLTILSLLLFGFSSFSNSEYSPVFQVSEGKKDSVGLHLSIQEDVEALMLLFKKDTQFAKVRTFSIDSEESEASQKL